MLGGLIRTKEDSEPQVGDAAGRIQIAARLLITMAEVSFSPRVYSNIHQALYSRFQKFAGPIFELAKNAPPLISPYPRFLIDRVPRNGSEALLVLVKKYASNPQTRQDLIEGIKDASIQPDSSSHSRPPYERSIKKREKHTVSKREKRLLRPKCEPACKEGILRHNDNAAYAAGYILGNGIEFGRFKVANPDSCSTNKFRVRLTPKTLAAINDVLNEGKVESFSQAGGFGGWFLALAKQFGVPMIFPPLNGLTKDVLGLLPHNGDSLVLEQRRGSSETSSQLTTDDKLPIENICLVIQPFALSVEKGHLQCIGGLLKEANLSSGLPFLGKVKFNPTIISSGEGDFSPPDWLTNGKLAPKCGILMPVGEKLTETWRDALQHVLQNRTVPFVSGSWSGAISVASLLATQRNRSDRNSGIESQQTDAPNASPIYLISMNEKEIGDVLKCRKGLIALKENLPEASARRVDELMGLRSQETDHLSKLIIATHLGRMLFNADYFSVRNLRYNIQSYDPNRFPQSQIFPFASYIVPYLTRYLVNLKAQSKDPSGLPSAEFPVDESTLENLQYPLKTIEGTIKRISREIDGYDKETHSLGVPVKRFINERLHQIGIWRLSEGTIGVIPLPRSHATYSPEIGYGDLTGFGMSEILNVIIDRKNTRQIKKNFKDLFQRPVIGYAHAAFARLRKPSSDPSLRS